MSEDKRTLRDIAQQMVDGKEEHRPDDVKVIMPSGRVDYWPKKVVDAIRSGPSIHEIMSSGPSIKDPDLARDFDRRIRDGIEKWKSDPFYIPVVPAGVPELVNPVHQNQDGKWYFWNEVWAEEYGPYETREAANTACAEYARRL